MSSRTYARLLDRRLDMTEWLIHFTRVNADGTPRQNHRAIIREGEIRPGWARRGGKRTIYGPRPAVCFTEQPLDAFLASLDVRADEDAISGYGIIIHKADLWARGGRPVISGMLDPQEVDPAEFGSKPDVRLLHPRRNLPKREQFRYVALVRDESSGYFVDWTHEREWRWPRQADARTFRLGARGGAFKRRIHFLVPTDRAADRLRRFISELEAPDDDVHLARWYDHLKSGKVKIISLEAVRDDEDRSRAEDWVRDPMTSAVLASA